MFLNTLVTYLYTDIIQKIGEPLIFKKQSMKASASTFSQLLVRYIQKTFQNSREKGFHFRINLELFNWGKDSQYHLFIDGNFTSSVQSCVCM